MLRPKRTKGPFRPSITHIPLAPTAAEAEIASRSGSTVADEAALESTQVAKKIPAPRLSQMIEQRTWENGQLRQELAYHQRKHAASMYLLEEVRVVVESLQQALANFQRLNEETEDGVADRECREW
ncbi:hypothetical protein PMIN04_012731 [Paraphaeosphaeria minitans]|uniref:Uncharacterized protein n=1 Tax=Paraphaeosphaeria minitans TaxID=565426 RepID=A0A9P6G822_9PLEO|nr:hypothetical protein PMIN01_12103 [Paraphaeosphaeria minitans]